MLTPTQMRWTLRGIAATGLALVLAFSLIPKADAATSYRKVGTSCARYHHLIWNVRVCSTVHVAKVGGHYEARPAAVAAGYRNSGQRRRMMLSVGTDLGRVHGEAGPTLTTRLVARGPWRPASAVGASTTMVRVTYPNGDQRIYHWRSNP